MFQHRKEIFKSISALTATAIAAWSIAGCIPIEAQGLIGHPNKKALFYAVVRGVQCEIRKAVYSQVNDPVFGRRLEWLRNWSSLMHFKFTFDTLGSFNPGVTFHTPNLPLAHIWHAPDLLEDQTMTLPRNVGQSYDFGLGAGVSADAVRVEDVEFFYPFNKDFWLTAERDSGEGCYRIGGFTIGNDLKLREWLDDVLEPIKRCAFIGVPARRESTVVPILGYDIGSDSDDEGLCPPEFIKELGYSKDNPIKTFSHDVSFIVEFSASATPTWNLVRISTSSAPLFAARRKDTFELIITLGSPDTETVIARKEKGDRSHFLPVTSIRPSQSMINRDLSMQIGSAVRDALRQ
ncbi:hypothetical protein [Methylocystis sp. SC2]|uniref:hypothetical protein n=1 Tax=Methylocystis sp. (strain SC2) TaxID=187303 RepID=UPI00027AF511|nr:hypothetical protein [Methylocystis sp. SC2]CCJ08477.1 Hypothetical protein BN69_3026 [Methylocystis sp. SC2]